MLGAWRLVAFDRSGQCECRSNAAVARRFGCAPNQTKQTNKQTKNRKADRYYTPHVKRFPLQLLGCFLGVRHSLGYSSLSSERERSDRAGARTPERKESSQVFYDIPEPSRFTVGARNPTPPEPLCAAARWRRLCVFSLLLSPLSSRPLRLSLSRRASAQRCRHVSLWCSLPCSRSAPRLLMRPRAAE